MKDASEENYCREKEQWGEEKVVKHIVRRKEVCEINDDEVVENEGNKDTVDVVEEDDRNS